MEARLARAVHTLRGRRLRDRPGRERPEDGPGAGAAGHPPRPEPAAVRRPCSRFLGLALGDFFTEIATSLSVLI